jgi:RNase adapter protein RapZ
MSEYVVIAGLSGGGRTEASRTFEDLGWFTIDNLPATLISKVADLARPPGSAIDRIALAVSPGRADDDQLLPAIAALRATEDHVRVVFLDASTERLVQRYESARRRHPFMADAGIEDAIEAERSALEPVKGEADIVIDTSDLNVHELRARINEIFAGEELDAQLRTRILSFGYKHGLPRDVDMVFDCRFLPNPHWIEELRPKTGLDDQVADYVLAQPVSRPFLVELERMLAMLMPAYVREGKSFLSIAFGCTGGHHRSVVIAEQAASMLRRLGLEPTVEHRDVDR